MLQDGNGGQNFLMPETAEYAKHRVRKKRRYETIDSFRLFNNMLSSQPLCFNLFHPLMLLHAQYPAYANDFFKYQFPHLQIELILSIGIEFIPTPIEQYIKDKSAFDAFILYQDKDGLLGLIAFETKYVEALGSNKARDNELKVEVARRASIFTSAGIDHSSEGCTQIYRNLLLAEAFRLRHSLNHSTSIILSPRENTSSNKEIKELQGFLKPDEQYKLKAVTLEDFTNYDYSAWPEKFQFWLNNFKTRYLEFDLI